MKSLVKIFLFLAFISSGILAQYDCSSFEDCLKVGIDAYQNENYEGAVGFLTNAINKWDRSMSREKKISAHMYRGKAFMEMDSLKRAYQDCCRVIYNFEENNIPAYRMRALVLDKQGEYDRSISDYTKVITAENNSDDYAARGIIYGKLENFDNAVADLSKAIELKPGWVDYYLKRAQIYFLMEKYDAALQDASKAQDLNAIIPDPYTFSATVYMKMGKFNEALEQLNSAITFAPEEALLYATRGLVFYKLDKKDEAIADLKKAVDLGSEVSRKDLKDVYQIDY